MKQEIEDRINHLANKHGFITPDIVINDAKHKDSPLHGEFEWDETKAAMAHWRHQARQLIASVKVIIKTEKRVIKSVAYVRDPDKSGDEQGYVAVMKVKSDKEKARDVLIDEFNRAGAALKRARRLAAVFDAEEQIDDMVTEVNRLSEHIEEQVLHS